jgi:hypothetical protein
MLPAVVLFLCGLVVCGGLPLEAFSLHSTFSLRPTMRRAISSAGRCSSLASSDPADHTWERFKNWAGARGMRFEKWHVGDVGGRRGAIADENIPEGFLLVSAPNDAVLSVRESDKCPLPESFVDPEYWDGIATKWDLFLSWKFGNTMRSDSLLQ